MKTEKSKNPELIANITDFFIGLIFAGLAISAIIVFSLFLSDIIHTDFSSKEDYEEAIKLYHNGSDIYLDGVPMQDFDIYGIDYDAYTIIISDDKDKIYLKSN